MLNIMEMSKRSLAANKGTAEHDLFQIVLYEKG